MLNKRAKEINDEINKKDIELEERDIYIRHLEQYIDKLKLNIINEREYS